MFTVLDPYIQLIIMSLQQNIGIFNVTVMQSSHLPNIEEYLVTVSPPPPYGPDEVITASSALISLENSTLYNIAHYLLELVQRDVNRTLVFGKIGNTQ